MSAATATAPALDARMLVVRLGAPHAVLSWAIVNGGHRTASEVAWVEVRDDELRPPVDPERLLRERLARSGVPGAVGLLTSRALSRHVVAERSASGVAARCVATVGLGNALRAGDLAGPAARIGTINVLCQLSVPLTDEALVEALSLAAEARTLAVLEAGVASRRSGLAATGTGTDCIVVAAPGGRAAVAQRYAGKHTAVGHVVGAAVHEAVARGAAEWLAERAAAAVARRRHMNELALVGGGVRSGKSAFALALARRLGIRRAFVATAQAFDREMEERIALHRAEREGEFATVEEPLDLPGALARVHDADVVVVDCLTLWLSNLLLRGDSAADVAAAVERLAAELARRRLHAVLVTNEVGMGVVPESALGRLFRDVAGRAHQRLARDADRVYLAALGCVLRLRPGPVSLARPEDP